MEKGRARKSRDRLMRIICALISMAGAELKKTEREISHIGYEKSPSSDVVNSSREGGGSVANLFLMVRQQKGQHLRTTDLNSIKKNA